MILGCRIDNDCELGYFCFKNACTSECIQNEDCGNDYVFSRRGRCVSVLSDSEKDSLTQDLEDRLHTAFNDSEFHLQVIDPPARTIRLHAADTQNTHAENLQLTATLLDPQKHVQTLKYRFEYDDHTTSHILFAEATTQEDQIIFSFPNPQLHERRKSLNNIRARLITSLGIYNIHYLQPSENGVYHGQIMLETIGQIQAKAYIYTKPNSQQRFPDNIQYLFIDSILSSKEHFTKP